MKFGEEQTYSDLKRRVRELEKENSDLKKRIQAGPGRSNQDPDDYECVEKEVLEKREMYRTLFEMAEDAFFLVRDGYFVDCNSATLKMFGCSRGQILEKTPYDFSPPRQPDGRDSRRAAEEKIAQALAGRPQFFQWRHRRLDGRDFEAEVLLKRVDLRGGAYIYAMVRDVTKRKEAESAWHESEKKYRTVLEAIGDGYYEVDLRGRFRMCNQAFCRILERPPEELKGASYRHCSTPEDAERAFADFRRVFQSGQPAHGLDWNITTSEGVQKNLDLSISPITDETGLIVGFRGLVRDISERKKAEEAYRKSEEKYKALYENAVVAMYRAAMDDGRALEINEVGVRLFGYSSREEMLENFRTADHYTSVEDRKRLVRALERHGHVDSMVLELKRKDGSTFWAEFSAKLYPEKGYVEGAFVDITARKRADEALYESERRYRELFNGISDMIMTHDLEGRFLDINPAVVEVMGYPREEIIGRPIRDFIVPKYRRLFDEYYLEAALTQDRLEGVFLVEAKDGSRRHIEYRTSLARTGGRPAFITGLGRDVTERIQTQRQLKSMQEQLLQAQKMEAVGALASGIAHDFNNILQTVSGYVQLMLPMCSENRKLNGYLQEIDRALDRASGLIKGLLTFGRKVKSEMKPIDLNREIQDSISFLSRTIPKMISIETSLSPDLPSILGDAVQLEQVIMNLVSNAKDALPQGGRIRLETYSEDLDETADDLPLGLTPGRWVLLRVSDDGAGIDLETLKHIYDPFFTTKGVGQGAGLGLSTVFGIIKAHGGHIQCRSDLGLGTSFEIRLPAVDAQPAAAAPAPKRESRPGGQETILVVDDEENILEVVRDFLSPLGYRISTASSGEEALEVYARADSVPDLIILDLGMPGMGGKRCLEELLKINPEQKVIIASGYSLGDTDELFLSRSAAGFIGKPYRLTALLETVRQTLS